MADSTEGVNFKVTTHGKANRKPSNFNPLTLKQLLQWIDNQPLLSDAIKEELKKMASVYPQQALPKWHATFPKHLVKAQETLSKLDAFIVKPVVELGDEPPTPRKEQNEKAPRISEFN